MRERFINVAGSLLDERSDLAIVLADISNSNFRDAGITERHPDRVLNIGIREQLLVSFAAGLALEGLRPIVHSYTPFLIERPFEQIKLDFGHQGLGGVFVSIGGSYDSAPSGRTHQSPGDVALLSTLPGWQIHIPGHPDEAEAILRTAAAGTGLDYIRLADAVNSEPHDTTADFTVVRRGSDSATTVIAVGPSLDPTLEATAEMDVTVLYATTVRPFDGQTLRDVLATPAVVLVEPYLAGTSSSEVSAALSDTPHRLLALGVPSTEHRHYGSGTEHQAAHGLDAAGIRKSIAGFVAAPVAAG